MIENWKDIPGYEGFYKASDLGNVKTLDKIVLSRLRESGVNTRTIKERLISKERTQNGYQRVTLCKRAVNKRFLVHRLIAMVFIPNPESKPCVNHINGIKTDNRVQNLEWCTFSENERHSYRVLGKINYRSKKKAA